MLRFFRKMRQALVSENKSVIRNTNYFKYALGEIVLVVIGILIALQINNNNQERKDRKYEKKMLTEIQRSIVQDKDYYDMLVNERLATIDSLSTEYMQMHLQGMPLNDSMIQDLGFLRMSIRFMYNSGAYEAIKASGLDKISNDSIRNALIALYDFHLPRTQSIIEMILSRAGIEKVECWKQNFEYLPSLAENGEIEYLIIPYYKNFWETREYRELLELSSSFANGCSFRINGVLPYMNHTLQLLNNELGPIPEDEKQAYFTSRK